MSDPTEYLHLVNNVLQRDLKALQPNHVLQLAGNRVRRLEKQAAIAEKRSKYTRRFHVWRVNVTVDGQRKQYVTRIKLA